MPNPTSPNQMQGLLPPEALFPNRPAAIAPTAPATPAPGVPTAPPAGDRMQAATQPAGQAQPVLHFQDMTLPEAPGPSQAELDFAWVQQLEQKLTTGYKPNAEEIRRYNDIQFQIAVNGKPSPTPAPESPVSPEELQWAQQLEQQLTQGYQPTAQERSRYQELLQRVKGDAAAAPFTPAAAPSAPTPAAPAPPATPVSPAAAAPSAAVSPEELQWAQQLHQRVQQGHQPSAEEVQRYENISARLAASQPAAPLPPGISQEEFDWAVQLEQRVNQGHQPSPDEVQRYEALRARIAAASQQAIENLPDDAPFSREDILWAQEIEQRVTQGYEPTPAEVQRYEDLSHKVQRFQARQR
ncbi:MAG: hypothetical protein IGS03_09210 [Candidatus Sericytochromatia bacterium]|nr:hypothetical protein [Candidatus Sericytochromatia bacterium]